MYDLYDVKISVRSSVKLLPEIKNLLSMKPDREKLFRDIVSGPWLDIQSHENNSHMMHYVFQHQKKQPRRKQRKDTEVPQPSDSIEQISDEVPNEENVTTNSHDLLLSGEDRLQLNELMDLCTKLQQRVLDLENAKTAQDSVIASLKKKVKKLERRNKSRTPRLKRLRKVGRSARIISSEDEVLKRFVRNSAEFIKGLDDQDGTFLHDDQGKICPKMNRMSVDDRDGVLDSQSDDGDGVLDSQTKDVIEEAEICFQPCQKPNFSSHHNDSSNHIGGMSSEAKHASSSSANSGNDEDVSHLDDNIEIDGPNAKDIYSNSQHHLHLLIKALGTKIENRSIDSVVVVPPKVDDPMLCTIKPKDDFDEADVDSYDDDYMSLFNDEEQPAKSSINDLELQQEPDIVDVKDGILEQQANANKGKTTNLSRPDGYKSDKVTVLEYMSAFINNKDLPEYRFPWGKQDIIIGRSFWLMLSCLNIGKSGWLTDQHLDLWIDLMWSLRPPKADWAIVYFPVNEPKKHWCLAHLEIRIGVVTFYDSLGWAGGSRRRWWRRMKKLLPEKLTLYLLMHGIFDSKGISADHYKITYNYASVPFQASLYFDCRIWVCIFIYRLCRNLPVAVDNDPLETAYNQALPSYKLSLDHNLTYSPLVTVVNDSNLLPVILVHAFDSQPKSDKILLGFGVRLDTLDPTIIKVSYPRGGHGSWYVSVFTLSSMDWKRLDNDSLPRESIRFKRSSQVVVCRLIFWAGHERFVSDYGHVVLKKHLLVSFDLIGHAFQVHDIDVVFRDGLTVPMCLSSIRNSMILSGSTDEIDCYIFCGWSVLVDVTSLTLFTLLFAIPTPNYVKLLGFNMDEISLPIVEAKVAGTLVRQVSYECGGFTHEWMKNSLNYLPPTSHAPILDLKSITTSHHGVKFSSKKIADKEAWNVTRVYRPKDIINDLNIEFNIDVSYKRAWKGKQLALRSNQRDPISSFAQLPYYCYNLKLGNDNTVTHIDTNHERRFQMLSIAFSAAIRI
ncbi:phospholipase-like protein [Tanacetum coccineum]